MRKTLQLFILPTAALIFFGGCLVPVDPEAERAAAAWHALPAAAPTAPVSLADALKKVPQKDRGELRAAFADLSAPGTPTGTVIREKARIKINVLLGYPPASKIPYDPAGALTAPAEIPDVRAAEKAALILHDGTADPLTLLRNVRLAHADAVLAAENLNENPSEMNRRTYFFTCLRLAAAIGLDSPMMTEVPDLERRMDEALTRLKKAEENHRR